MHKYLRAIGLADMKTGNALQQILEKIIEDPEFVDSMDVKGFSFAALSREFSSGLGICVCGEYDEEDHFHMHYYFPYYRGREYSYITGCRVSRRAEHLSFSMMGDDVRLGFPLIFFLINGQEFMDPGLYNMTDGRNLHVSLSALSTDGEILLPIYRTEKAKELALVAAEKRKSLVQSAIEGDVEAIESLGQMESAQQVQIHHRMKVEDLYSVVDTNFMPTGMECDMYTILGDILECEKVVNKETGEAIWKLLVESNDKIHVDIAINDKDLFGEPAVGRRFKGDIWLQGYSDHS